jgi:S-adenosylmethionine synthetase
MYGYATDETPEMLPKAVVLAHQLTKGLEKLRQSGETEWLRPDGKSQVTMSNGQIRTILVSAQHDAKVEHDEIQETLTEKLIRPLIGDSRWVEILVNPTGKFVLGGFAADTGVTGRKIMVDTYGGLAPQGGGAFSGKDPTKVDRSAAYMGRFVARHLVEKGMAKEALVAVAYAIGRAAPVMIEAQNERGEDLSAYVKKNFDFRPLAIIERLDLRRPIYRQTAVYGHFGRGFPWG